MPEFHFHGAYLIAVGTVLGVVLLILAVGAIALYFLLRGDGGQTSRERDRERLD
jgi:hypothetical protein